MVAAVAFGSAISAGIVSNIFLRNGTKLQSLAVPVCNNPTMCQIG